MKNKKEEKGKEQAWPYGTSHLFQKEKMESESMIYSTMVQ